jgi:hypothetical protein
MTSCSTRPRPTRQDAIILNIQRACEAAIDLAMHVVRRERLGIPQETRQAFELLRDAQVTEAQPSRPRIRSMWSRPKSCSAASRLCGVQRSSRFAAVGGPPRACGWR